MASIDYQRVKKELEAMFTQDDNERKIIFWYDALKNFEEDVKSDNFEHCRLLIWDKNEFEIKKIIEHDDLSSNFLVYVPHEKPLDKENWLLDITIYSEEYYADEINLIMRRFNLTSTDLRRVIEAYKAFFDSNERSDGLSNYVTINDDMTPDDLKMAMMSVLVKPKYKLNNIENILAKLVLDDEDHSKYYLLKKFGFEEYLLNQIGDHFNYEGELNVDTLIKRFIITAFLKQIENVDREFIETLPSYYEQFIIKEKGINDALYFIDKIKKEEKYEELQNRLALDLKIEGLISSKDIATFKDADVFECVDKFIIEKISKSLESGSLDYESFKSIINKRHNSIWHKKYENEYNLLESCIKFLILIDKSIALNLSVNEYIELYTNDYFKIDMEYRHVCTSFKKIRENSELFENLVNRIEDLYQKNYLDVLGREYTNALKKQNEWDFVGINMTSNFYQSIQKYPFKKLFVIISDALRYEIGYELYEQIKVDSILKGSVNIKHAMSPLPSETRQGMACLLPHKNMSYENKEFMIDGMSTEGIQARDNILKARNSGYAAITFEEIDSFSQTKLRQYMKDKTLVYIYHNVIDNAGEHTENKVFDVVKTAIDEILNLVKKLYNNLQISNFFITSDHGFIYRRNEIHESNRYSNIASLDALEVSKRYVLTNDSSLSIPYTTEFNLVNLINNNLKVIVPNGYDLFKTQGGGIQYVHGGASLQETVVPIIHISELRSSKLKDTIGPVGVRLKSITRKITNRSFTLDFEQYEKVEDKKQAITCVTYIIDENGEKVSGEYKFIADSSSDDPSTRVTTIRYTLKNIQFDRYKPYFMVLKNIEKVDEYIEKIQFMIDIIGFKIF